MARQLFERPHPRKSADDPRACVTGVERRHARTPSQPPSVHHWFRLAGRVRTGRHAHAGDASKAMDTPSPAIHTQERAAARLVTYKTR